MAPSLLDEREQIVAAPSLRPLSDVSQEHEVMSWGVTDAAAAMVAAPSVEPAVAVPKWAAVLGAIDATASDPAA